MSHPVTHEDWQLLLDKPRIYADLNGGYRDGELYIVRLDSHATQSDLQKRGVPVREGAEIEFWTDDGDSDGNPDPLLFTGTLHLDENIRQWVAVTKWAGFRSASELRHTYEKNRIPA